MKYLVLIFSFFCNFSIAEGIVYYKAPISFSGVDGVVHSNVALQDYGVYGYGVGELNRKIDEWDIGDFTQYRTGAPLNHYQVGVSSAWYGATSVQVKGTRVGVQMHTWSMPGSGIKNITIGDSYAPIYPWANVGGPGSNLCLSYSVSVPAYFNPDELNMYITGTLYISDPNGKNISIQLTAWDKRGAVSEGYFGYDPATNSQMIGVLYRSDSKFSTLTSPYSSATATGILSSMSWFSSCISRENLKKIVEELNGRNLDYSVNYSGYRVSAHGVQPEIVVEGGKNAWLAVNIDEIWLTGRY